MALSYKDPLTKNLPRSGTVLYERYRQQSNGFPVDSVINASQNMIIEAIRTGVPTRKLAEDAVDKIAMNLKRVLLEQHYDPVSGKRRSTIPFTQSIGLSPDVARLINGALKPNDDK